MPAHIVLGAVVRNVHEVIDLCELISSPAV